MRAKRILVALGNGLNFILASFICFVFLFKLSLLPINSNYTFFMIYCGNGFILFLIFQVLYRLLQKYIKVSKKIIIISFLLIPFLVFAVFYLCVNIPVSYSSISFTATVATAMYAVALILQTITWLIERVVKFLIKK